MKTLLIMTAAIAVATTTAWAGAELPEFHAASSCTTFGQVASAACIDKQEEIKARTQKLWLQADDQSRQVCQETAQNDISPYETLSQCLSLHLGQKRLFAGGASSWWTVQPRQ